jgi:hypothetical protein
MRIRGLFVLLIITVLGLSISFELLAQECTEQVQELMTEFSDVCAEMGAESACAGRGMSFNDAAAEDGTIIGLGEVQTAAGSGSTAEDLSLSMMNIHANVPLALSETGLRMMLVGNSQIENLVDAANAFTPVEAIPVVTFVGSNLRAAPSTDGRVISSAAVGTELLAYGQSADLQWLIALIGSESVWISKQVVQSDGDLNSLPVIDQNVRSLMQSFRLTTDPNADVCLGTPPSMLVLQGPNGFSSLIEVNGVQIRLSSTIVLRTTADNMLQLIVLDGGASSNSLSVPEGFTMFIQLDNEGMATGGWTGLRPISPEERGLLLALQNMPQAGWYSPIQIPTEGEIAQTLASLNSASVGQSVEGPASGQANCGTLRPTSPLGTMGNRGDQPFYWDGAAGATTYRLSIFNDAGGEVSSVEISSNSTTAITNTTSGAIGNGTNFSWQVQALVNGAVACTSGRVNVVRDATAQNVSGGGGGGGGGAPAATPTACTWSC